MTDATPSADPPLDRSAIADQAAALAAHLQRSGVQWLPNPDTEGTAAIANRFAPNPESESRSESLPAATTPTSATPTPTPATTTPQPPKPETLHPADSNRTASARPAPRINPVTPVTATAGGYQGESLAPDARAAQLKILQSEVESCTACPVLSSCRTQTVFGEGSVSPRVVFFGEGPGADEDRTGRPFVGKAGQLLTKMIEACSFHREDVFIMNTVKCRPPANRNPEPDELSHCRDFYQRQLAILRPEYIVCLGAVAAQELLQSKLAVGRLRGQFHMHFDSKVLVTYHPAYLLRNPAAKKATWIDLQLMLHDAGIQI